MYSVSVHGQNLNKGPLAKFKTFLYLTKHLTDNKVVTLQNDFADLLACPDIAYLS